MKIFFPYSDQSLLFLIVMCSSTPVLALFSALSGLRFLQFILAVNIYWVSVVNIYSVPSTVGTLGLCQGVRQVLPLWIFLPAAPSSGPHSPPLRSSLDFMVPHRFGTVFANAVLPLPAPEQLTCCRSLSRARGLLRRLQTDLRLPGAVGRLAEEPTSTSLLSLLLSP